MDLIGLDIFNLQVAVFRTEKARCKALKKQGCSPVEHDPRALSSAHLDYTEGDEPRLSLVIKDGASIGTKAHECSHIVDFVFDILGIPGGIESTEVRAYMIGHLMDGLAEIEQSR